MRSFLFRCGLLRMFALAAAAGVRGAERCANGPLPERPDTLRILGVGNSFTDDGMMYLPDLLRAAGIGNVVLGRLYYPRIRRIPVLQILGTARRSAPYAFRS